jgi:hypothetical protein
MGINYCLKVVRKAQKECRKLIAILNEGRDVTKGGVEFGYKGGLRVRGSYELTN